MALRKAILRALLGIATCAIAASAFAQDTPVERPSVDRPALPQPSADQPAPVERPATAQPAPASAPPKTRPTRAVSRRTGRGAASGRAGGTRAEHAGFLYLAAGLGLLTGRGGGKDFERSNPAITGLIGVELPVGGATGLGFELAGDAEFAGDGDRGAYTAAVLRARLGRMLTPSMRLWCAIGVGRAGYITGSLAGAIAVGSTFMLVPKFGLDLSANLNRVGASSEDSTRYLGVNDNYEGGLVLLVAVKAMFELHRTR